MFWRTPTYKQGAHADSVSLQIESLQYVFQRLHINKLAPISKSGGLQWTDGFEDQGDDRYNLSQFRQEFLNDEYRILVDFLKNKFRSYCILGEATDQVLVDYNGRRVSRFRFSHLPTKDITANDVCSFLVASDIYAEHGVSNSIRHRIALSAVAQHLSPDATSMTLDQRADIIRSFLTRVAFEVQLMRIYNESIKQKNKDRQESPKKTVEKSLLEKSFISPKKESRGLSNPSSRENSRPGSPVRPRVDMQGSPIKSWTESPTLDRPSLGSPSLGGPSLGSPSFERPSFDRPPSPSKSDRSLSSKPSIPRLRHQELYLPYSLDEDMLAKCRNAIKERLRKERRGIDGKVG